MDYSEDNYAERDALDLMELVRRYRTGYSVSCTVEEISERWAAEGRECFDIPHRDRKDIPLPPSQAVIFDKLMKTLKD